MTPEDAGLYFKTHRSEIEGKALQGDVGCLRILNLRKMFYDCPNDPGALGLLVATMEEYAREAAALR